MVVVENSAANFASEARVLQSQNPTDFLVQLVSKTNSDPFNVQLAI